MGPVDEAVLILSATRGDASHAVRILSEAGVLARVCADLPELALQAADGCGCVFVAQEALPISASHPLAEMIARQPPWSDLPVLVGLVHNSRLAPDAGRALAALGNILLLDRPLSAEAFIAAIRVALRARARQYLVRDLMRERDQLNAVLEQRVKERTAKLAASLEQLEAFSYTVSHDLRSPLRTIAGFAEMLVDEGDANLSPKAADCARRISRAALRLDQLTTDLLTYACIARDDLPLSAQDLDAIVRAAIEEYPSLCSWSSQIEVQSPLGVARAHRPSLTQCIANLLENAIRFVKPGEPLRVRVYSEVDGDKLRLCVADCGIGIAPQHQAKIFQIFETLEPARGSQTGIGLAIVQKAVQRMGGKVGVQSAAGEGATFWIELMRGDAPACSS